MSESIDSTATAANPNTPFREDLPSIKIRDRELEGYLGNELPNPLMLIPPPPEPGSMEWSMDQTLSRLFLKADQKRVEQAKHDAILRFPEGSRAFNTLLNGVIDPDRTPGLYRILNKTRVDGGRSTGSAKRFYRRPRPFMVNHLPTLTPLEDEILRLDGSYPSGHTAIGWIWALILSELIPSGSRAILERGFQFGISRMICNVHWHSDVWAGRKVGTAVTGRLFNCPEFIRDISEARRELARAGIASKIHAA